MTAFCGLRDSAKQRREQGECDRVTTKIDPSDSHRARLRIPTRIKMASAASVAAEANTIFDILNLYIRGPPNLPNPETSHRYYQCHEPPPNNRMGLIACEQITYEQVKAFYHKRETSETMAVVIPIEQTTPKPLDQAVLSCKLRYPAVITLSK